MKYISKVEFEVLVTFLQTAIKSFYYQNTIYNGNYRISSIQIIIKKLKRFN